MSINKNNNNNDDPNTTPTLREVLHLLLPQALVGLVDAVAFMIVAPSLIFYVRAVGGTKEHYGLILSAFSFASFCFKPVLGYWSDKSGLKFRNPYLVSIAIAAIGALLYFIAGAFHGLFAVSLLFIGRFLSGFGAANSTLGFTYIAAIVPPELMTQANALLSMVRILGMVAAPGLNVGLHLINFKVVVGNFSFPVNELNSVGLIILIGNVINMLLIYFLLVEPSDDQKPKKNSDNNVQERAEQPFWTHVFTLDILVPLLSVFTMNANFQLVETGMAPAASDALGWGPVAISTMFAVNAVVLFAVIFLTFWLSAQGVTDMAMIVSGLSIYFVGNLSMYIYWKRGVSTLLFILPFTVASTAFPLLGAPTRSVFTRAVSNDIYLQDSQGTMQAIMSMMASVAGFSAPSLIATYVLRTPAQVEVSRDGREFTAWALFAPALSMLTLIGFLLIKKETIKQEEVERSILADVSIDEQIALLDPDYKEEVMFHPQTEARRRQSIMVMQIPPLDLPHELTAKAKRRASAV